MKVLHATKNSNTKIKLDFIMYFILPCLQILNPDYIYWEKIDVRLFVTKKTRFLFPLESS